MEVKREGKRVQDSSVVMSQLMSIQDTNIAGNVHGGGIMKLIDTAAGVAAVRHARANAVTASIDRLDFHHPVFVGDVLTSGRVSTTSDGPPWKSKLPSDLPGGKEVAPFSPSRVNRRD